MAFPQGTQNAAVSYSKVSYSLDLAAHWNQLENFKNNDVWLPPQWFWLSWLGVQPGHQLISKEGLCCDYKSLNAKLKSCSLFSGSQFHSSVQLSVFLGFILLENSTHIAPCDLGQRCPNSLAIPFPKRPWESNFCLYQLHAGSTRSTVFPPITAVQLYVWTTHLLIVILF